MVRLWDLDEVRLALLAPLPAEQATLEDLNWTQAALQDGQFAGANRAALEFIAALLRWKTRFDIVVDEAPKRITAGEFDIEIEG
jgi:hypothetical protein